MIDLTVNADKISYYGRTYTYYGYDKVDNTCVHLNLDNGWVAFLGGETKVNGILKNSADEIIASL